MLKERINNLKQSFYEDLVNNMLPFRINNSVDREFGGFNTFLDRKGGILCTDKPTWVQGRVTQGG